MNDLILLDVANELLEHRGLTVDAAAALKAVSPETIRRILRDEWRRSATFPNARQTLVGWILDRDEVIDWQPRAAGRPDADFIQNATLIDLMTRTVDTRMFIMAVPDENGQFSPDSRARLDRHGYEGDAKIFMSVSLLLSFFEKRGLSTLSSSDEVRAAASELIELRNSPPKN